MPSVVVSWNGICPDHKVQEDLCAKIAEIGEVSRQLYQDFFKQEIKPQIYNARRVRKNVLLSGNLLADQPVPNGIEIVNRELSAKDKGQVFSVSENSPAPVIISGEVFLAKEVRIYGIEFALFDPRRYNSVLMMSHQYDVSFVFIRSADPGLDGRLAQVSRLPRKHALHKVSPVLLSAPELDLRYYLEGWIGDLLGWVKHFYIPDLYYWAWIDNPNDHEYEQYAPDDQRARDEIFLRLQEQYRKEAEACQAETLAYQKQPNRRLKHSIGKN